MKSDVFNQNGLNNRTRASDIYGAKCSLAPDEGWFAHRNAVKCHFDNALNTLAIYPYAPKFWYQI